MIEVGSAWLAFRLGKRESKNSWSDTTFICVHNAGQSLPGQQRP